MSDDDRQQLPTTESSNDEANTPAAGGAKPGKLEDRAIRASDPELSPRTNDRLTEELRDAVGKTHAEVPADRPHASAGQRPKSASSFPDVTASRLIFVMGLGAIVGVALVIALTLNHWWLLPLAFVVLAAVLGAIVMFVLRLTQDVDHPSASLSAAMQAEGVTSPDHRFSQMVEEFRAPDAPAGDGQQNERNTTPQEDPATASVEQANAITPASQRSDPQP